MIWKLKPAMATTSFVIAGAFLSATTHAQEATLTKIALQDKIKGAWAGQTIGVTYGFPVEFRYNSTMVPDSHILPWYDGYLKESYEKWPAAYDDVYVDLTFVKVIEEHGVDAPAKTFADAIASANYTLWFANQVARSNVLNGVAPPQSGHWLNNPAAEAIDFQIEADFIGIMYPGMINSAGAFSDKIGHIMNYGDGWYGGAFVAAMYAEAFVADDVKDVIKKALSILPRESKYHQIISDVIALHKQYPDDWKTAWFEIHKKWSDDDLEPVGANAAFNIDAKINGAWVVLGLLYGDGEFGTTLEIATRAGDDADCNPATAAGILGVLSGYSEIPDYWKQGLADVEELNFSNGDLSMRDGYELSYKHALQTIERGGGSIAGDSVVIKTEKPKQLRLERAFDGHYVKERRELALFGKTIEISDAYRFDFEGTGFVVLGSVKNAAKEDYVFNAELWIDGEKVETVPLPTNQLTRRFYLFWKYQLPRSVHYVEIKLLNPADAASVTITNIVIYDNEPAPQAAGLMRVKEITK